MLTVLLALALGDPEVLIARLGSDSVEEREAATQELIKLGRPMAELVKPLLKSTDPEIAARARIVYDAVTRITWLTSVEDVQKAAKDGGRLSMVLVAFNATSTLARTNRETFGDTWLVDYVRDNFVCAWSSRGNAIAADFGLAGEGASVGEATYDHMLIFANAEGKVVHMVYGNLGTAEDLLDEAKLAKAIAVKLAEGKKSDVAALHAEHTRKHADAGAIDGFSAEFRRNAFTYTHSYGQSYLERPLPEVVNQFQNPRLKG